jgi:hypothetical protein
MGENSKNMLKRIIVYEGVYAHYTLQNKISSHQVNIIVIINRVGHKIYEF